MVEYLLTLGTPQRPAARSAVHSLPDSIARSRLPHGDAQMLANCRLGSDSDCKLAPAVTASIVRIIARDSEYSRARQAPAYDLDRRVV